MNWTNHVGKNRVQPPTGAWTDWKQAIADTCEGRCVYCAIHEGRHGGLRSFHVEHFRPKSRFKDLQNTIGNLYLACAICNVLKSDDWPGEPVSNHSATAYPDPGQSDYNLILLVDATSHEVKSKTKAGRYLIQRVMLNRPQILIERRLSVAFARVSRFEEWCNAWSEALDQPSLRKLVKVLLRLSNLKTMVNLSRPYEDTDTKRPVNPKAKMKRSK